MSSVLYRIGRFCARRVRLVIGVWLVAAVAVVIAAGTVGGELEDTFEVPGLDSQVAVDLLSDAESERAGLTARLVATPADDAETFFDSPSARDELTRSRTRHRGAAERAGDVGPCRRARRGTRAGGVLGGSLRRRPRRDDDDPVSRTRRTLPRRPRRAEGRRPRPETGPHCRSRWAATCSSTSRRPAPSRPN